jgi:hypothetical protein
MWCALTCCIFENVLEPCVLGEIELCAEFRWVECCRDYSQICVRLVSQRNEAGDGDTQ